MHNIAVKVTNLTKVFHLYDKPIDRLKETLHPFKKKYRDDFYALNDISFELSRGEVIGILGVNGAGKSTLLKIITGVLEATSGNVSVNGQIASILELGTGFNDELSGRENIYFNAMLNGYNEKEVDGIITQIIEFVDIGDFIEQPIKTYSSGMKARLAFGVAVHIDPEILIIDEALSVGDARFQQKCLRRIEEFKKREKTIILVSHSTGVVERFCDRAIWIHNGKIKEIGKVDYICKSYYAFMSFGQELEKIENKSINDNFNQNIIPWSSIQQCESFGTQEAVIDKVALVDSEGDALNVVEGGEPVKLFLSITVNNSIPDPIVGFIVKDKLGSIVFGTNSYVTDQSDNLVFDVIGNYTVEFSFEFPFLRNGEYTISPAFAEGDQDNHIQHHWVHDAIVVKVLNMAKDARNSWLLRVKDFEIYSQKMN